MKNKTFDFVIIVFVAIVINVVALFPELNKYLKYQMDLELYQDTSVLLNDKAYEDELLLGELHEEEIKNKIIIELSDEVEDLVNKIRNRYNDIENQNNEISDLNKKITSQTKTNNSIKELFE